jgi:DNA polymerase-3 subunit beta
MKIIFEKAALLEALTPAMGSVSNKNTMNSTEGFLIESEGDSKCIVSAYDLEKGMRLSVACKVVEGGSYIIKADKLVSIVRAMPENEITVEVDKRNVTKVSSGRSSYELHAMKGEDFPNLPDLNVDNGFTLKQGELKSMIIRTMFAVAQNDIRPALNGEFFSIENGKLTLVSCDSNRLAVMTKALEIGGASEDLSCKFILPGKSLTELIKLLDDSDDTITVRPARKHVVFKIGDICFFSRLIDEEYIDYDRFIPKTNKVFVKVNTDQLCRALERAMLVTEEKSMGQTKPALRCTFCEDALQLSSVSVSGSFNDEILVEKDGEDIVIGFNCRYLYDAVKSCDTDEIKLSMSTPLMSMIIEPADASLDETFTFLVLPVRLKN